MRPSAAIREALHRILPPQTIAASEGVGRLGSCALLRAAGPDSLWPDDIDRDLHRRYRSLFSGQWDVYRSSGQPTLGPYSVATPFLWSLIIACKMDTVPGRPLVVDRAEDASGLDGHHPHSKLVPFQALDLAREVERCQHLHCDTLRLSRCHLLVTLSRTPLHTS